jgi:hypothetical protein
MCYLCHKPESKSCSNCAKNCKCYQYGPDWHCGSWSPGKEVLKKRREKEEKIRTALDDIWDRIERG